MTTVKLIAATQSFENSVVSYVDAPDDYEVNAEGIITYCARVSNPANQNNKDIAGLLRYCMKHGHWSVFEMANAVLEINTTRDIGRQLLRHRSFSFQEFSQRYADPTKDLDFVLREARLQDTKNRQNSIETDDIALQAWWDAKQKFLIEYVKTTYAEAIEKGIAKEQARAILPEGNTVSRLYMNGTLRSWIHFIELRSANGTQKEHQLVAQECAKVIAEIFPLTNEFVSQ